LKLGVDLWGDPCYYNHVRRRQPPRKEVTPMSVMETIALLTLVIAAISLGHQIKK